MPSRTIPSKAIQASAGPRERLLAAADKLFYEEGIHTVGIDRVIEEAGVAKASLYSVFGSKDELVRAYLTLRQEKRRAVVEDAMAKHRTPRAKLLAVFDVLERGITSSRFRGCAFMRASAEGPTDRPARRVCDDSRAWLRSLFVQLATNAKMADPARIAAQLVLLYDGASVSAHMDHDATAASTARDTAAMVFDAAPRTR